MIFKNSFVLSLFEYEFYLVYGWSWWLAQLPPPECNFTPVLNTTVNLFPGWVPLRLLCVPTQKWVHLWGKSYIYMLLSLFLFLKMKWKMLLWNIYISPHNTELSFPSDYYKNLKLWIVEPSDSSFNKNVLLDPFKRPLKSL